MSEYIELSVKSVQEIYDYIIENNDCYCITYRIDDKLYLCVIQSENLSKSNEIYGLFLDEIFIDKYSDGEFINDSLKKRILLNDLNILLRREKILKLRYERSN